ncbi:LOW QUALITY PROTEIN: leucine-rich repeat-containing protein 74B-like [Nycticebus coucang]|uniref:LOW QUALITY PROTEIN: leucine-rich repeat-containing protein 74B-like n=1 Tax=Nycticebus coucang TaxID=9470 RepID=UPI00234CD403|nr:LOW QUALITY PROTEIN: leucine-rich repeat-containing protein 74B-like [Nycticebus coucang]
MLLLHMIREIESKLEAQGGWERGRPGVQTPARCPALCPAPGACALPSTLARSGRRLRANPQLFLGQPTRRVARATAKRKRVAIACGGRQSLFATFDWSVQVETPPTFPGGARAAAPRCEDLRAQHCEMSVTVRSPREKYGENEDVGKEAAGRHPAEVPQAEEGSDTISDSDLETEGPDGCGEPGRDTLYLRSCQAHGVVPISCFLHQASAPELNLRHHGLGPQGVRALASSLASNPYVKRLDLGDNGLCGAAAEALAVALSKSSSICDVDLSENQLGAAGAQALCATLAGNPAVQKIQLSGNGLEEQAAQHLAELMLAHTGLRSLDLSYNQLNDEAGEMLGPALAENTGLTELNISWNHLRGPGAIAFARGLEANIFLKVLDISYNGFGDPGASAVGEALKVNNVLEELNMSNNRISAMGALSLGLGLRVNQTLRILVVSRNPMRSEGCFGLLRSVRDNPAPALELLDFSDIQVNAEFDDLASSVKVILPGLCVKTGAHRAEYEKELLPVFRLSLPAPASK